MSSFQSGFSVPQCLTKAVVLSVLSETVYIHAYNPTTPFFTQIVTYTLFCSLLLSLIKLCKYLILIHIDGINNAFFIILKASQYCILWLSPNYVGQSLPDIFSQCIVQDKISLCSDNSAFLYKSVEVDSTGLFCTLQQQTPLSLTSYYSTRHTLIPRSLHGPRRLLTP